MSAMQISGVSAVSKSSPSHEPLEIPGNVIQSLGLKITLPGIPLAGRRGGSGLKSFCLRWGPTFLNLSLS